MVVHIHENAAARLGGAFVSLMNRSKCYQWYEFLNDAKRKTLDVVRYQIPLKEELVCMSHA